VFKCEWLRHFVTVACSADAPLNLVLCAEGENTNDVSPDKERILEIIESYQSAANDADADRMESLFWHEDDRFSEIENHIAVPFGEEVFLDIGNWIRNNAEPGPKQRFHATTVHMLTDDVAYSVSLRDELEEGVTSRVTFIFLKRDETWKIIHGHFSHIPTGT